MRDTVLIVDDVDINRIILSEILRDDYNIEEARGGNEAIEKLFTNPGSVQAVLLDIMMPDMNGFDVLRAIKANPAAAKIPVIILTASEASNESRGLHEGAVDYISKPFDAAVVKARIDNHIALTRYRSQLEHLVEKKTRELSRTHEQMLETLATIIEYRSLESGVHIKRTSELTQILIAHMLPNPLFHDELTRDNYISMIKAASMHDIGKVGIPDNILLKPGKLTPEEFEIIKKHSIIGANIMGSISSDITDDALYLKHCRDICRWHHERWDGKGYPDGVAGGDIALSARILSVIDVYDALVSRRCYKPPISGQEALKIIMEGRGTQFDPNIVDVFCEAEPEIRKASERLT